MMAKKKQSILSKKVEDLRDILSRKGQVVYGNQTDEIKVLLEEKFIVKTKDKNGVECYQKK